MTRPFGFFASLAMLIGLVACGIDGGAPIVTSITIGGVPAEAMIPGQSAQLKAVGTYSDGSTTDLTASASWMNTDPAVLSTTASGFVTAVAPGSAAVVVTVLGAGGAAAIEVVAAPTWAVADRGERSYRLGYELDAQRRIKTYQLLDEELGRIVQQCSGDLNASPD